MRRGDVDCGATRWPINRPARTANRSALTTPPIGRSPPRRTVKLGVLAALAQRIVVRCHTNDVTCEEGVDCLSRHLALAGRT
ncbi:hypothetical protein GCM10009733_042650 [Nonomuraea maheshkhaliensis]|uniref:Uncharacterized protein n=1 Tax=Nonomuraea maheshkhaliensis TaxID=419590 RepID=A0ABN2FCU0_9ACTN